MPRRPVALVDRLASLRDEPAASEAAVRAGVWAGLRERAGAGPPPATVMAATALRVVDRRFVAAEPAWFVSRRRVSDAVAAFARSRLARRLFALSRSRVVAIGGPGRPYDAIVAGRRGERYGVCLALSDHAAAIADRARRATQCMIEERHAIAPTVLVFSCALGAVRTFRSHAGESAMPERRDHSAA
jgi:hypothetical protein